MYCILNVDNIKYILTVYLMHWYYESNWIKEV